MIISCGEALADCFRKQQTHSFDAIIGGSPLNVAVALANAGSQSALMTNISNDQFGDMHINHLTKHNVNCDYITRSDHLSGLMFVQYNPDKSASYNFYGHDSAELNFDYKRLNTTIDDHAKCLHFGSFSLVCGQSAKSFNDIIEAEKSRRVISVDINIRTAIEPNMQIWESKFQQLMQSAHILKASSEDLCLLYNLDSFNPQHALEILQQWSQAGVTIAVITDAENGAYTYHQGALIHQAALDVNVVDTVGAGDCFMAFFLNQLEAQSLLDISRIAQLSAEQLNKALAAGLKAAAYTVAQKGAVFPKG
jgi:fructokinase